MSNVDKIRAEIERLIQITEQRIESHNYTINDDGLDEDECKMLHTLQDTKITHLVGELRMLIKVRSFLDRLPQEPISNDLDVAAEHYACRFSSSKYGFKKMKSAFIAGAEWDANHCVISQKESKDVDDLILKLKRENG